MHHYVAYFSPAGSTRLVAETIAARLAIHNLHADRIDLGRHAASTRNRMPDFSQPCCLWIGSPVYCDHAVPLVEAFIDALPANIRGYAVPFVTWGGVCSGLALPEMARHLQKRGLVTVAAAKVVAAHSSTWASDVPFCAGHPDSADLAQVERLVDAVVHALAQPTVEPLALEQLDYQSAEQRAASMALSLAVAKAHMPPLVAQPDLCDQCGTCADACPTGALRLDPSPRVGPECVLCMQCVRTCPQGAFPHDAKAVAARIEAKAQASAEPRETVLFL
ncbi:MAG: EFR1 family ferrodoxin [Desulfobulbus sp.]|jgi:ferredoxin